VWQAVQCCLLVGSAEQQQQQQQQQQRTYLCVQRLVAPLQYAGWMSGRQRWLAAELQRMDCSVEWFCAVLFQQTATWLRCVVSANCQVAALHPAGSNEVKWRAAKCKHCVLQMQQERV
jgi:hypothetical protein